MSTASERGDVILHGLLNMLLGFSLFGLILFEFGAVVVNTFQLDDVGHDAARAAAAEMRHNTSLSSLQQAAMTVVDGHQEVRLDGLSVDRDIVTVTVSRPAPVLLADRLAPLRKHLIGTATHSARGMR